mgnify:CR=1 FL=1
MVATRHLDICAQNMGGRMASSSNRDVLDKLFNTVIGLLEEGSSETRTLAKRLCWHIYYATGRSNEWERLLRKISSESKVKQVRAIVESPKGIPAPPRKNSSRLPSRGKYSDMFCVHSTHVMLAFACLPLLLILRLNHVGRGKPSSHKYNNAMRGCRHHSAPKLS